MSCGSRFQKYYQPGTAFDLFSDDSRHFLKCIQELGFETKVDEENCVVEVNGCGGRVPKQEAYPYVGSAGTAARFSAAYLGISLQEELR